MTRRPEVMDDFLRNFFVKMGLQRTSEVCDWAAQAHSAIAQYASVLAAPQKMLTREAYASRLRTKHSVSFVRTYRCLSQNGMN